MSTRPVPRGIRNNNPGNIRRSRDPWQGLVKTQTDEAFLTFETPVYGIRALARTLITYQDKYFLRTTEDIINRWAPPAENRTGAYIASVTARTGRERKEELNLHSYQDLRPLVEAIIQHENGQQPYPDAQIDKALVLAGVEPPQKPLPQTRTVKAAKLATASTAGTAAIEAVQQIVEPAKTTLTTLAPSLDAAKWALLALTLLAVGVMVWARIDDRRRGLR
ncbi:MAG: structural protein P5 [Alphaproteobacteria bacterium]|nr:MAG: structural protein P5 [Alphaproteobacteria bacterium]